MAKPVIVSGPFTTLIRLLLTLNVIFITIRLLGWPVPVIKTLIALKNIRKNIHGLPGIVKFVKSQGRYFWSENIPGWPSKAFNAHIRAEISRISSPGSMHLPFQTVIWAISNCCPLKCKHCCEGENLGPFERLSPEDLKYILQKLIILGLYHIQLSGGEPLSRFNDLLDLLRSSGRGIDFWILTSGYGLTREKAMKLRAAGLTGATISLDHWEEEAHNAFRNHSGSFHWARQAVQNCREAGILTGLSICVLPSFVSEENLLRYYSLAKEWDAGFIRVIEPSATGGFSGKDVLLRNEQLNMLNSFYLQANSQPAYRNWPIVMYPGYHQRKAGCFGAGNRYFYIDVKGDIHACPFCRGSAGNALLDPLLPATAGLRKTGCKEFRWSIAG